MARILLHGCGEVTTMAQEEALGVDFAQLYKNIQVAFLFNQIKGSFFNFFFSLLFLCFISETFWPALK
jgi:hypothetical protein